MFVGTDKRISTQPVFGHNVAERALRGDQAAKCRLLSVGQALGLTVFGIRSKNDVTGFMDGREGFLKPA